MRSTIKFALFILVCSCLAGLLAACQPQNVTSPVVSIPQGSSGGPELTPTLEPTPSLDQVRSVVIKALLALNTMPNQMDVTTVTADGQAHKNMIEFIPKGTRLHGRYVLVRLKKAGDKNWLLFKGKE